MNQKMPTSRNLNKLPLPLRCEALCKAVLLRAELDIEEIIPATLPGRHGEEHRRKLMHNKREAEWFARSRVARFWAELAVDFRTASVAEGI